MKIYTVKDTNGNLYPKTILEVSQIAEAVRDGQIVEVDYGFEIVMAYIKKSKDKLELAVCELNEITNY